MNNRTKAWFPSNATHARNAGIDTASILAFWPLRRLRQLRPLRTFLHAFLASLASKSTQVPSGADPGGVHPPF